MKLEKVARRFLPAPLVTLIYWLRFGCFISPRAEVELNPHVRIGRRTEIGSFTKIKAFDGPLDIGQYVSIGTGCTIGSGQAGMRIGDDCLISPNVTIMASNYRYDRVDAPIRTQGSTSRGVTIANNVWLGAGVMVLDGSNIGAGAIVAPNSVVSGRVPPNTIARGDPAKVIFERR